MDGGLLGLGEVELAHQHLLERSGVAHGLGGLRLGRQQGGNGELPGAASIPPPSRANSRGAGELRKIRVARGQEFPNLGGREQSRREKK